MNKPLTAKRHRQNEAAMEARDFYVDHQALRRMSAT